MKTLSLLLLSQSLLAQVPQGEPRIAREPSPGDTIKAPLPTGDAPAEPPPGVVTAALLQGELETVLFDVPDEGGALWALGADYKASFEAGQWTFIGRPTAEAERLQPLTFRLADVHVGGKQLSLSAGPAAERVGNRVHLVRGPVVETLDLRLREIEQTFTFTSLPQRGELVLGIALDTELVGQQRGDGLWFAGAWTEVGYTGAIAIDADGDRIAAATRLVDGRIEIRVPAEFVTTASLPLVIDPVVSSGITVSGSVDVGNPDLVFSPGTGEWHVVYQRLWGGADWDCFVRRMSSGFIAIGTLISIDLTTKSWFRPRIAHLQGSSRSMVVAELRQQNQYTVIGGRIHDNGGVLTTGQLVLSPTWKTCTTPDIGGDPAPGIGSGMFSVVWTAPASLAAISLDLAQYTYTGAVARFDSAIVSFPGNIGLVRNPSISKSCGAGNLQRTHAIVFQNWIYNFDGGQWDIFGTLRTWDGQVKLVNGKEHFPIDTSILNTEMPCVSSPTLANSNGDRLFVCAYENVSVNAGDIEMVAFKSNGTVVARGNLNALEGDVARRSWPQRFPSVDCDGTRFAVGYHENHNNSAVNLDARITTVSVGANTMFAMDMVGSGVTASPEFAVQIASKHSSSGVQDQAYATVNDRDSGGVLVIEGDVYSSLPTGVLSVRSTSCGGGVSLSASGQPLPGNTLTFNLSSTSPAAGFWVGNAANSTVLGCSCIVGVDSLLTVSGTSHVMTLPPNPIIIGARLSVQGWMNGSPGTSCFSDLHLTNTIDLVVR